MANDMIENDEVQVTATGRSRGTTQPMTVVRPAAENIGGVPITYVHTPSYHPTRWPFVNHVLDVVERVTGGRAGWFQRLFSYLFVGGFAAIVNLFVFYLMYYVVPLPFDDKNTVQHTEHYLIAFVVATEISILANFIPNDRITFSHLPGHSRSWLARCLRFHLTCIAGTLLTLAISYTLHLVHLPAIVAQAIALIIVTAFNFTFHHLFTYRHTEPQVL
ncbi:MAG: GtrA family protein [Ktedonobacterales bacterium]